MSDEKKDVAGDILPMKSDLDIAMEQMRANFSTHLTMIAMRAQMNWVFYNELVKAGFSKEEALELVKTKGV